MNSKFHFFGFLAIILAILAGISLIWASPQKQLAFAAGDSGGGDGGGGGGDGGGGGGDGGGGSC
jgi:hypothetical protein